MKTIDIQRSTLAWQMLLGFVALVSLLIAMIGLEPVFWLVSQALVMAQAYRIWRNTVGLGTTLRLVFDGTWWVETGAAPRQALTMARSGWVCPALVTAEIHGATERYSIVVPFDALSSGEHWELRRLLIQGVAPTATVK